VGPRAGLDTAEKRKSCTAWNRTWAIYSGARRYTDSDNMYLRRIVEGRLCGRRGRTVPALHNDGASWGRQATETPGSFRRRDNLQWLISLMDSDSLERKC
jgi:hypothetical protein